MAANQNMPQTPKAAFRAAFIIHMALVIGQVLFGVVAFSINNKKGTAQTNANAILMYLVPGMAITCFIASVLVYRQIIIKIPVDSTLMQKLSRYQTAMITRDALLEGASLFAIVAFLRTGNVMYLIVSGIIVFYFILLRPTKDKLKTDLNLSYEEELELN